MKTKTTKGRNEAVPVLLIILIAVWLVSGLFPVNVNAQGVVGGIIRDKVRNKVIEKTEEKIDEAVDEAFDGKEEDESAEDQEQQENDGQENEQQEEKMKPSGNDGKPAGPARQKLEMKSQYDFVPGDQLLFYEDFSQDAVGDFPALWTTTGSGEVKTINLAPGHWLHMNATDQVYNLMKDLNLPENFIFEFDVVANPSEEEESAPFDFYLTLYNSDGDFRDDALYPGNHGVHVTLDKNSWEVRGYHNEKSDMLDGRNTVEPVKLHELNHVILWVQKARMRIYHNNRKVIDLPTTLYTPTNYNRLRFSLWSSTGHPLVSNLRFTTAAPDTRSKLLTEGKLISYGIYFDVNSDRIKPESKGAVGDIAKVLNENPDVRIRIDGHTDSDGDNAMNLDLSKRRAAAVKTMLTNDFAVSSDRIETNGFGETKPVAENNTSEGKAKNRRVEFIKL